MVFQTLPIEFDSYDRARLRDEEADAPFDFIDAARLQRSEQRDQMLRDQMQEGQSAPHQTDRFRSLRIDPLTRTPSPLAIDLTLDFEQRRVLRSRVEAVEFSPFEMLTGNRRASDAVSITSRTRGGVGGSHAIASALALEMAGGITPPPLAIITRNLGACGELVGDCARHLFLYAGPDYSEPVVSAANPHLWKRAQSASAPNAAMHGFQTIAELMAGLTPFSGDLYLEALSIARTATEIATLVFGKSPHPSTIFPGGNGIEASRETFNLILGRINTLLDFAKKATGVWDDLVEFMYGTEPHYRRVGELSSNFLSVGLWDDPEYFDATYANCNDWGSRRFSAPGVIVAGELRTSRLTDLNIGLEEFVDRARYSEWTHQRFSSDPLGNVISPRHPWNRETLPDLSPAPSFDAKGGDKSFHGERTTWLAAPRWDREPMECGSIARLWVNALSRHDRCEFVAPVRGGLEINVPKGSYPAKRLIWRIPERPNALERLRAAAYQIGYAGMVAFGSLLTAFDCLRRGEIRMSNRFLLPDKSLGCGFWENGSGAVTHHLVVKNQLITNYQIIGPGEWLASSGDSSGSQGIIETALINTPILEEFSGLESFRAVDMQRVVRSFAP